MDLYGSGWADYLAKRKNSERNADAHMKFSYPGGAAKLQNPGCEDKPLKGQIARWCVID